jgi:hypothetical protein
MTPGIVTGPTFGKAAGVIFRLVALFFPGPLNLFKDVRTNGRTAAVKIMSRQIIKVSVSLAAVATSAGSLFAIGWIGLALLGF